MNVFYSQLDPRWKNVIYSAVAPHNETIGSAGCGICSACMVVSSLTDKEVLPPEMASYSVKNGFRIDGTGTAYALYPEIAKKYHFNCEQSYNIDNAIKCVKNGGMVVCSTDGGATGLFSTGGHLFILAQAAGNNCYFLDPMFSKDRYSKSFRKPYVTIDGNYVIVDKNIAKNHISTYFLFSKKEKVNEHSYDDAVNQMILDGVTTIENMQYWEKELAENYNFRTIIKRYQQLIK